MGKTPVQVYKCIQEMKLIHLVAKIFGLAPFSIHIDRDTNQEVVNVKLMSNISGIAASLVVLTTILSGFIYGIIHPVFTLRSDPGDILCNVVSIPIYYISTLLLVTMIPTVNRSKIEELVRKLVWIDEHLAHLLRRSSYDRKKRSVELYLPILTLAVLFMCYDFFLWSQSVGLVFCTTVRLSHIITLVAKIQFCKTVMMIRNRLSGVEEVLSLKLPETSSHNKQLPAIAAGGRKDTNRFYSFTYNIVQVASADVLNDPLAFNMITADTEPLNFPDKYTILKLRKIYNHIYECTKIINSIFGLYILLEILRNLTSLTSVLYSVVRLFNEPIEAVTNLQFSDFLFSRIVWIIIFLGTTTSLTVICGTTASKSTDIAHKIQTLLLEDSQRSDVVEQLNLFSQQMSTDRVVFTAAGFFDMDTSVLCAFLASVTTYIIVLIQFKSR
jgi:hypothetical protein